jgi:hypothetical protein
MTTTRPVAPAIATGTQVETPPLSVDPSPSPLPTASVSGVVASTGTFGDEDGALSDAVEGGGASCSSSGEAPAAAASAAAASVGEVPSGPSRADPAKWYCRSCTSGASVISLGERTADTVPSGAVATASTTPRASGKLSACTPSGAS